jgi:aquaglyceroporin related protein
MSYFLGYGHEVWSAGDDYFWVPFVVPFLGCLFGGLLYDLFIYTGLNSPTNDHWMGVQKRFMKRERRKALDKEKGKEEI